MATVSTGMSGDAMTVVLQTHHEQYDITEHLQPEQARKLAVRLMSAASRAERAGVRPDWP